METIKNVGCVVVLFSLVTAVLYAVAVFATLEPNPIKWSLDGRAVFAIIDVIITIALTAIMFTASDQ